MVFMSNDWFIVEEVEEMTLLEVSLECVTSTEDWIRDPEVSVVVFFSDLAVTAEVAILESDWLWWMTSEFSPPLELFPFW